MVQRKALHKLGILADSNNYVQSEMWSLDLKPSSQHQDIQDKDETELKKQEIKKSRWINLLDLENIEPPPTRRPKSRLHKLPTNASSAAVDQPVPSMIKKRDPSPNYMKPTSSSDAKKERSQVSPHGYQASCPRKSLSPNPCGRNSNRMSASPCPSGRNSHGNSPSPSPSGRNSYRMSLSPTSSGRNSYGNSLSPSPSGRNSYSMSPSRPPSVRNSYHNSLSPSPSGRNSYSMSPSRPPSVRNSYHNSLSPSPSGRNSHCKSLSPFPNGRNSHCKSLSPCPSGRNSHCKSLSPCPRGRNSNRMSLSPCPSGRTPNHKSPSPCPSRMNSHGNSLSPSLSRSNSDHKPCSASGHKPVKTSTKTSSLKPARTLIKTPSFRRGTESKKQTKKSRSMKLLDLKSLQSSPMEQTKLGFDESPGNVSSAAVTPNEQSLIKTPYLLPNYMKPTSSSGARKEHLQASTQGSQTSCPSKSPNESNLIHIKPSSASGHKQSKTQMKTSSLKPVRTLLKTSSLRLARPSMKHNSDIALRSSLNAGRATCSSTLKDSKFPAFLTPSPHTTASERTTMRICPYTYCSLSGHCHTPLPQLKHFLSARRRLLKTQKSLRPKNLSPLEKRPPGEQDKETDMVRMSYNEDPTAEVVDLAPSTKSLVIKEDGIDFFVEIYAKPRDTIPMPVGRSIQDGDHEATIIDTITSPVIHGTEIETENDAGNVHEKPEELSYSDISLEGNTQQNSNLVAEMDARTPQHDQFIQLQYADYQSCFITTETGTECCSTGKELQGESTADTVPDESSLEADREEGQVLAPPTDGETDLMTLYLPESNIPGPQQELVFKLDDIVNDSQEFPAAGLLQKQVHTENVENFNMDYGDHHSETNVEDESFWPGVRSNVSGEVSDTSNCPNVNLFSSTEIASEEPTTIVEERDGAPEPDETFNSMAYSALVENLPSDEKDEELQPENFHKEQPEPIPITDVVDDALVNEQESRFLAFTNNLLGTDVGGDAEEKEQAEDSVEHGDHGGKSSNAENKIVEEKTTQVEDNMESDATKTIHSEDITRSKEDKTIVNKGNNSNQQLLMTSDNLKRTMRCRRPIEDQEEPRKFNPGEPKYIEIDPEPEPEKVDLKHQRMDERKNSKEWMCDYALQQAVGKLAPAHKQRVALLVEAFETVIPPPECETQLPGRFCSCETHSNL